MFPMVVRPLHPETPTMAPQVRGARGEELVEIVREEEEGGIREEVEGDTEGETLVISSSSKATELVSFTTCCTPLIYGDFVTNLISGGPTAHGASSNGPNMGGRPPFQKYVTQRGH